MFREEYKDDLYFFISRNFYLVISISLLTFKYSLSQRKFCSQTIIIVTKYFTFRYKDDLSIFAFPAIFLFTKNKSNEADFEVSISSLTAKFVQQEILLPEHHSVDEIFHIP
jgi:hypothetical protein